MDCSNISLYSVQYEAISMSEYLWTWIKRNWIFLYLKIAVSGDIYRWTSASFIFDPAFNPCHWLLMYLVIFTSRYHVCTRVYTRILLYRDIFCTWIYLHHDILYLDTLHLNLSVNSIGKFGHLCNRIFLFLYMYIHTVVPWYCGTDCTSIPHLCTWMQVSQYLDLGISVSGCRFLYIWMYVSLYLDVSFSVPGCRFLWTWMLVFPYLDVGFSVSGYRFPRSWM